MRRRALIVLATAAVLFLGATGIAVREFDLYCSSAGTLNDPEAHAYRVDPDSIMVVRKGSPFLVFTDSTGERQVWSINLNGREIPGGCLLWRGDGFSGNPLGDAVKGSESEGYKFEKGSVTFWYHENYDPDQKLVYVTLKLQ